MELKHYFPPTGDGKLEVLTKHFAIRKPNGDILLNVDGDEVIMAADKMKVTGILLFVVSNPIIFII